MTKSRQRNQQNNKNNKYGNKISEQETNLPSQEALKSLPENVRTALVESATFSGPLPPSSMLSEYNKILPGSAERLLTMTEKEQNHRMSWENKVIKASIKGMNQGQWFGFIIAISAIIASLIFGWLDHKIPASILGNLSST